MVTLNVKGLGLNEAYSKLLFFYWDKFYRNNKTETNQKRIGQVQTKAEMSESKPGNKNIVVPPN